jgi:hypothetical protein
MTATHCSYRQLRAPFGAARRALRTAGAAAIVLTLAAAGSTAVAQGTVSGQGFGYPTGQLSSSAMGAGGAMAEFDPFSPLNPASLVVLAGWRRPSFSFQYDPEFRRVTAGGRSQSATLTRFPIVAVGVPVGARGAVGLSASTLLDRTFSTTFTSETPIGGELITATESIESRGSVADLRLGAGWAFSNAIRVGLGGHVLSGENRLVSGRVFADTLQFGRVADSSVIDFSGIAASAGVELRPVRGLGVAASYRKGGRLRTERNDSTLTSATAPDRMGVAVRFDRVAGAAFGVSYARNRWSNLQGLGATELNVRDGTELAAGAEVVGPRYGNNVILLRLGGRRRDLPFGVGSADVRETAFSGGLGAPLAGGRALFDLALQHASRTTRGGADAAEARERAWTLSLGFTVRP